MTTYNGSAAIQPSVQSAGLASQPGTAAKAPFQTIFPAYYQTVQSTNLTWAAQPIQTVFLPTLDAANISWAAEGVSFVQTVILDSTNIHWQAYDAIPNVVYPNTNVNGGGFDPGTAAILEMANTDKRAYIITVQSRTKAVCDKGFAIPIRPNLNIRGRRG